MFEWEDKMIQWLNTALVGWKSPHMWALVSELPVKTNRMCLWLLLGLSTKPSSMGCIQREQPHRGDSEPADTVSGWVHAWALCHAQGYHSASSSLLNSFPGSAGHDGTDWARARLAWITPAETAEWSLETSDEEPYEGSLVFVGKWAAAELLFSLKLEWTPLWAPTSETTGKVCAGYKSCTKSHCFGVFCCVFFSR